MESYNPPHNVLVSSGEAENQAHYVEQIIDSLPQAVLLVKNNKIIRCNASALLFFGVPKKEGLIGRLFSSLSPKMQSGERLSEQVADNGIKMALQGGTWREEWSWMGPKGELIPSDLSLTKLMIDGEALVLASIFDISDKQSLRDEFTRFKKESGEKIALYEGILDSLPYPVIVTDLNRKFTFVNKEVETVMDRKKDEIIGHPCSEWGCGICNTDNCAITRLASGSYETCFDQSDRNFSVDCSFLVNSEGKKTGHVEIFTDVTRMVKQIEYLLNEVSQLANNLKKLADGDLNLDYEIHEPDEYNRSAASIFRQINSDLMKATDAINLMMEDVMGLSEAAINGELEIRVDISRHKGDYTLVIQGINETLDAILGPVQEGIRVAEKYSKGNFNVTFNPDIMVSGELLHFRDSLIIIGNEISRIIGHIKKEVQTLNVHANNAITGVDDVSKGAKEIAIRSEETSQNAEKAEDGISQVLQAMSDLTVVVSEISANADTVARLSEDANSQAKKGSQFASSAENGMKSITDSSNEVERIITEIREEMTKIRKIVNIITDLANQTNLLALNAAIEAARAGDAGRGFAVVASEVKSLAQESRSSAESITDMIQGLERKSEDAASAIETSGKAVIEGNLALSDTLTVFNELTDSVEKINENMLIIAKSTEHQVASFQEITASANEMSAVVKKTAEDAIQSSATSEEALSIVDQITTVIRSINIAVDSMEKEMQNFIIKE